MQWTPTGRAPGQYQLPEELHYLTPPAAFRIVPENRKPPEAVAPIMPIAVSGIAVLNDAARAVLLQVRDTIRARHYSYGTEKSYLGWIRRFIVFNRSGIQRTWV